MNILDLEEFEILEKYKSEEYYKFVVKAKNEPMFCSRCGAFSDDEDKPFKLHDTRPRTVKDVDLRGMKVILEIKQRRYNCPHCNERFTEFLESVAPDDKVTRRLWEHMGKESIKGKNSFSSVAEWYGVSVSTVKRAFEDYVQDLERNRVIIAPKVLGIDEVYIKITGHKRKLPCGVFVDIENHRILEFVLGNSEELVKKVIKSMQGYENIQAVTMDMAIDYRNAVYATLPQAYCVIDRFHVIQKVNMKLDDIRSKIQSQLYKGNDELDNSKPKDDKMTKTKGKSLKDDLYRVKDLIRANREDLDERAILKLDYQLELYPKLKESYWLKEKLRLVYHAKDKKEAHGKFFEWEQSIPNNNKQFKSLQKTINSLKKEMLAFFDGRYTNAYTESFNNQIKRIVRLGSGYSYETLRAKVLYGSEATKKVKVKDMNFYAIELVMNKKEPVLWSYTEDEYYTDGVRYIDSYYTDIEQLLSIIENGDF